MRTHLHTARIVVRITKNNKFIKKTLTVKSICNTHVHIVGVSPSIIEYDLV